MSSTCCTVTICSHTAVARETAVATTATKGGAREALSVVCDQVDQVVPAHQVDDIDEVHELDPVHQVDHKDEFHFCDEVDSFCALCGRQPLICVEVVSFCARFGRQPLCWWGSSESHQPFGRRWSWVVSLQIANLAK